MWPGPHTGIGGEFWSRLSCSLVPHIAARAVERKQTAGKSGGSVHLIQAFPRWLCEGVPTYRADGFRGSKDGLTSFKPSHGGPSRRCLRVSRPRVVTALTCRLEKKSSSENILASFKLPHGPLQ